MSKFIHQRQNLLLSLAIAMLLAFSSSFNQASADDWKVLEAREIAQLVNDCIKHYITEEQAKFALMTINIDPDLIDKARNKRELFTNIIRRLSGNQQLGEWLLVLATDGYGTTSSDWKKGRRGRKFALEWLDKVTNVENEEERVRVNYVRERFLKPNTDLLQPVSWLLKGWDAANSVAKLKLPGETATGFLITENLLLTNHHVLPDIQTAKECQAIFNYYERRDGSIHSDSAISLNPEEYFFSYENQRTGIDFAIVGIARQQRKLPKINFNNVPNKESPVYLLGHRLGFDMEVTINNNKIQDITDAAIIHTAPTDSGSSGSPIFNFQWQVIGVHFGSSHDGKAHMGTRISKIIEILKNSADPGAKKIYEKLQERIN